LSLVFQFLDPREFSLAGRTCRSWSAAASLPSAWCVTADFSGVGRILRLKSSAPQCSVDVLPSLPLWRHARALHFVVDSLHGYDTPGANAAHIARATQAVSMLPRVEYLHAQVNSEDVELMDEPVENIGPRLLQARFTAVSPKQIMSMRQLRVLTMRAWNQSDPPGAELAQLHQLTTLELDVTSLSAVLGPTLRTLSLEHELKVVALKLWSTPQHAGSLQQQIDIFFAALAGVQPTLVDVSSMASPPLSVVDGSSAPATLERLSVLLTSNESLLLPLHLIFRLPHLRRLLLLDCVRAPVHDLSVIESLATAGQLAPLESLTLQLRFFTADLPVLAHFTRMKELMVDGTMHEVPSPHTIPVDLPPQCLSRWLQSMQQLESLHLDSIQFPGAELSALVQLPNFHTLKLVQEPIAPTTLSLSHLDVLTQCPRLTRVDLIEVDGLQLLARHWMEAMHAELDSLRGAADASAAVVRKSRSFVAQAADVSAAMEIDDGTMGAPAAPSVGLPTAAVAASSSSPDVGSAVVPSVYRDLLSLLSSCRRLSHFTWASDEIVLKESVAYTAQHTRVRHHLAAELMELHVKRQQRERARERHALRHFIERRRGEIDITKMKGATAIHPMDSIFSSGASSLVECVDGSAVTVADAADGSPPPPAHVSVYIRNHVAVGFKYLDTRTQSKTEADGIAGSQSTAIEPDSVAADAAEMAAERQEENDATQMHMRSTSEAQPVVTVQ
jgi:hypothetical protein